MSNNRVIRNMRHMAWERAKGELKSMSHTYWAGEGCTFEEFDALLNKFIQEVEDNGLHE